MPPKLSIEKCREKARELEIECLETRYINSQTKMRWKCPKHGEFLKRFVQIRQGSACQKCGRERANNKTRKTIEDCQKLAEKYDGDCLSTIYQSNKKNLKWRCILGHEFESRYDVVSRGHWCSECQCCKKYTIEDCHEFAKSKKAKCLETHYINNGTPMKWLCENGHEFKSPFREVKRHWCFKCHQPKRGESQKLTIEHCQKIATKRNGKCLSKIYEGSRKNVIWECNKGHKWMACHYNVNRGTWCPKCRCSKGEREVREYLTELSIIFKEQKTFDDLRDQRLLSFDFFFEIEGIKIAIEYDGEQHFRSVDIFGGERTFEAGKRHDKQKSQYCLDNGINLIRIGFDQDTTDILDSFFLKILDYKDMFVMFVDYSKEGKSSYIVE